MFGNLWAIRNEIETQKWEKKTVEQKAYDIKLIREHSKSLREQAELYDGLASTLEKLVAPFQAAPGPRLQSEDKEGSTPSGASNS